MLRKCCVRQIKSGSEPSVASFSCSATRFAPSTRRVRVAATVNDIARLDDLPSVAGARCSRVGTSALWSAARDSVAVDTFTRSTSQTCKAMRSAYVLGQPLPRTALDVVLIAIGRRIVPHATRCQDRGGPMITLVWIIFGLWRRACSQSGSNL